MTRIDMLQRALQSPIHALDSVPATDYVHVLAGRIGATSAIKHCLRRARQRARNRNHTTN